MEKTPDPKEGQEKIEALLRGVPGKPLHGPTPPPVMRPADGQTGRDLMSRIGAALDLANHIASTMGDLGDYDRDETAAFVRSMEAQMQDWARNLITRKERNLAELKKIVGELKPSGDKHDERTKQ